MSSEEAEARLAAMNLLARREHSRRELTEKLVRRFDAAVVAVAVDRLAGEGLQSDERFAEAFVRQRAARGYGPLRIRQELQQRGVAESVIALGFEASGADWTALAVDVAERKYGTSPPDSLKEKARRQRFLQYRGFAPEHIRQVLK